MSSPHLRHRPQIWLKKFCKIWSPDFLRRNFSFPSKSESCTFSVPFQLEPENALTCRTNNQSWLLLDCPALANTCSNSCFVAILATNQPMMALCVLFLLVLLRIN